MIWIRELRKRLGGQTVLRGVTLQVERGEVVAVTGPSGTGKSVLLKHVVGLLRPDSGDVVVDGVSVPDATRASLFRLRRRMGYAFQDGALLDSLTVYENLLLALPDEVVRSSAAARARSEQALAVVNLEPRVLDAQPRELSGGMRKRVGVARAVINRPSIILYDEPTTGLDPANARTLYRLIRHVAEESGATSVVVSHDIDALSLFADRVITLTDGRVVSDAAPHAGGRDGRTAE